LHLPGHDNAGMTFHINSPLGAGTTFGTGSVSAVRGERGLGFFRLNVTVEFVVEPTGSSDGQPGLPQVTELMAEVRIGGRSIGRFTPMPGYLPIPIIPRAVQSPVDPSNV
jgi:hypothetical protein